jgi:hypothetical protein
LCRELLFLKAMPLSGFVARLCACHRRIEAFKQLVRPPAVDINATSAHMIGLQPMSRPIGMR